MWIYGINPVKEAIRSGRKVFSIYIYKGLSDSKREGLIRLARAKGIQFQLVEKAFFRAFPKAHQGVAARTAELPRYTLEDLPAISKNKDTLPFYLLIDEVEDPHNLGAIIRTAEVAGVHAVVVQKRRSAGGPTVAKASAGAIEHIPLIAVPNIKHAMDFLKSEGVMLYGASSEAELSYWEADFRVPLALVVGSEGRGIRASVKKQCNRLISIPMFGKINSLNVSVATGVIVYEVLRQRKRG
ncbi:MAG: 23S rRNA (guanosine(2251)-2'-O)-methyltransferase RlmB [Nitrospirae bacterium]|nr:MAG: 23S rRNA (guanosine(2251)-2'-O)-methyltransferase RlmB [Nitrospirota bacterium]